MNKAITEGLVLSPPPFANGLDVWSRGDGTPGTATYEGYASAALVPADQDFGGCLEIAKTEATQVLRYMGETPLLPGCYLRIKARVKAVSGNLPGVRVSAFAGGAGGVAVPGVSVVGPSVTLTSYGDIVEVSAIVGVRGMQLAKGDEVISMSILHPARLDTAERDAYLRFANARRRAENAEEEPENCSPEEVGADLDEARIAALEESEEFILSVASDGLGKRTSAYEYRVTARGGKGIDNMDLSRRQGQKTASVVAAFPVAVGDQLVLVTDRGKLIRCPVDDIRIAGRATRGVKLFDVAGGEEVVSVTRLEDDGNGAENGAADGGDGPDEA